MKPLSQKQLQRFETELEQLKVADPTYQFLTYCVELINNNSTQYTEDAYMQSLQVLIRHQEYLAYRLGLLHGSQTD